MELTLDQMQQQGLGAHNAGNLQEAERLYRAILQVQPKHPDANHNLGLIAVAMNQSYAALALFKTAVEANPCIEQFWLTYIEALIAEQQFEDATRALKKGKKKGVAKENLKRLTQKLKSVKSGNLPAQAPSQAEMQELVNHYQNGLYGDAESLALSITQEFPGHPFSWKILGGIYKALGRMSDALAAGKKAVELDSGDNQAHNSLGVILEDLGWFEEAEASYRKAVLLKPDDSGTHYNLGNTMRKLEKFEEAAAAYRQAIAVMPDYAEAHSNLGVTLKELGRLEEAEASHSQAIALKSDFAEAHCNLGITLKERGRLDEAEASHIQAIALKPDFALAHFNLGKVLYIKGNKDLALKSIKKANEINPKSKDFRVLSEIMTARKSRAKSGTEVAGKIKPGLSANPFILRRLVEPELIADVSAMGSREMDNAPNTPVYGNGVCSLDYDMFGVDRPIIKSVESDLVRIIKRAVQSEVYVCDSFFNIYGAGAGIPPHSHLNEMDTEKHLYLAEQKYSLVYYLSVGDQNCSEPGMLKLYDPSEDILPYEGMIVIFPAGRRHSAVYGGEKRRVIIGINFYSL